MALRPITSKIYGSLGAFQEAGPMLYRHPGGNVHLLGEGNVGGKGEGVLFLEQTKEQIPGYATPRSLIVCDDFFGIPPCPTAKPVRISELPAQKIEYLFEIMNYLNLPSTLALRSSAQVEDQINLAAAGKFLTQFHGKDLTIDLSRKQFIKKLLEVYNSAYSEEALPYWEKQGYINIPPLSVIIQELVGSQWECAPQYFLPAVSGIANTSLRKEVKVCVVLGLGLAAVSNGLGIFYKLRILENGIHVSHGMNRYEGNFNYERAYALDLESGNALMFPGTALSNELFPPDFIDKLGWDFPYIPQLISHLALRLEQLAGFPVDIEWAISGDDKPNVVQLRPIKKRDTISKPNAKPEDIILQTKNAVGYGEKEFKHLIYIGSAWGGFGYSVLESLISKYPDSFICLKMDFNGNFANTIVKNKILPFSDAVIFVDPTSDGHTPGSNGMDHFSLNMLQEGKFFFYTDDRSLFSTLEQGGKLIEKVKGDYGQVFEVLEFDRPLRVAADDEFGWGMIYFG